MTDKDKLSREDLRADRAAPPRRGTLHRILVLVAVLAVVLGAVLAAAYLDLSNFDSLRRALSYDKADAAGENTYDYDNDRTNRFALLGDRLLVVSTTRVSVLADDGSEVYAQEVKLDSPAIALGGRTAAVYDVGGTTLYILGERGLVRDLSTETENGIISAKLNSSDMLALVTDKSGYKSSVSVYNASGERVFTFNSSNRYMIDACVERGGKHVAVATLGSEDAMFVSTIRRYALDQETAVSACVLDDSLLYELSSFGGTLVAVTDDRFLALIGATLLTAMFVEPVTDLVYPKVEERVLEQFERDIPSDALAAEDGDLSAGGLLPDELSDLLGEALDTLKRFGVSDDAIDGVTKSVTDSAVSAAERAAYLLVKTIVQAALFLAFFLALMLLLRLLTHGLDRLFSLPVLAQLNGLGGAALSLMEGALLIFLIVFLAPRLGVTWFADHAAGTHLLAWFLNNTPRSIIASLT